MPENTDYANEAAPVVFNHPVTNERIETFQSYKTISSSVWHWHLKYTENNHTCLVSNQIFMGDIDDLEFDWLSKIDEFPQYSFRFYRTYKGFRFFITNTCLSLTSHTDKIWVDKLFNAFNCDKLYTDQVWLNSEFAARLTRKPDRDELYICRLIYDKDFDLANQLIKDAIKVHDSFCLH